MSDPVLTAAMVISHHCEWTKAARRPEHPIVVAPAHELATFDAGQQGQIRANRFRQYLYLPAAAPQVDRELVVDLRLVQPISGADLRADCYWTSSDADIVRALRAKVIEFITRELTSR